jgi:hypothetical protein
MTTLKVGSLGYGVGLLKLTLADQGFWPKAHTGPEFTPKLKQAVEYFQSTHLGRDGEPLTVDGKVGDETRWALKHPTGKAQRSGIPNDQIPEGLSNDRRWLLEVALGEHGIKEKPNGSNRGSGPRGGVDKYLPAWCKKEDGKGPAWCCFCVSWVLYEHFGYHPLGRRHGSCKKAWEAAKKQKMHIPIDRPGFSSFRVMPGDAFVMLRRNGTGHIGFVYRVCSTGQKINTIEGNCGNRVKIGRRDIYKAPMHGFINFFGDAPSSFEKGLLISADDVSAEGTR